MVDNYVVVFLNFQNMDIDVLARDVVKCIFDVITSVLMAPGILSTRSEGEAIIGHLNSFDRLSHICSYKKCHLYSVQNCQNSSDPF